MLDSLLHMIVQALGIGLGMIAAFYFLDRWKW